VDVWGVDIISMSFGFTIDVQEVFDAVIYAYSKNVLMIAAASNDGNSRLVPIAHPARLLGLVICMNSTNAMGFPSRGNPPAALHRDNFSILGERVKSTWSKDANRDGVTVESDGLWKRASGTSVATPVAAAVVSQIIYWKRVHWIDIQWHSKLESYGGIRQMLASMVTQKTSDRYQYILPSAVFDARVKSALSGTFTINLRKIYS
jgi:Subtilase family